MTKGSLSAPEGAHLNEANFRRFEPLIQQFLDSYPSPLTITPENVAPTTCAARFRDAVNAALTRGYESSLDLNKLQAFWSQSIATIVGKSVLVGPKHGVREAIRLDVKAEAAPFAVEIHDPTAEQLDALAVLHRTGVFGTPSKLTGVMPALAPEGVAIERADDHWLML